MSYLICCYAIFSSPIGPEERVRKLKTLEGEDIANEKNCFRCIDMWVNMFLHSILYLIDDFITASLCYL